MGNTKVVNYFGYTRLRNQAALLGIGDLQQDIEQDLDSVCALFRSRKLTRAVTDSVVFPWNKDHRSAGEVRQLLGIVSGP